MAEINSKIPLSESHPAIAAEWHPTKNGSLTPDQIVAGSHKKAWWKCPIGPDHEWWAYCYTRTSGRGGCPYCAGRLEVILDSWEEVLGIKVDVQQTEWGTFLDDLHARRYQMFTVAWGADYPDPENCLDILFHNGSDSNQTNYSNIEVDALLEQARIESNQTQRFEMLNRIEQMILDDAPCIPLWTS
jgi:ABC-type transport system substrate-binding protein